MAQHLMHRWASALRRTPLTSMGALLLCSVVAGPIWGEELQDPMRPPTAAGSAGVAVPSGPALQSIMIGPGRRSAIISGETVRLGDIYGDARVVRITESEVVLKSATGSETLRLFPEVAKQVKSVRKSRATNDAKKR